MRNRILSAAADMLVKGGAETSMSSIAKSAGVATGSLYNHFESKDALIQAVYEDLAGSFNGSVVRSWEEEIDLENRLFLYIDDYITFIWDDPKRASLFEYLSSLPLVPQEQLLPHFAASADYIAHILKELQNQGVARNGPASQMAGFMGGAIRNTLKWHRISKRPFRKADRQQIISMCFNAIRNID